MKTTVVVFVLVMLSVCSLAQAGQTTTVSIKSKDITLNSCGTSRRNIQAFSATVPSIENRNIRGKYANVIAFFDPSSGAFWWKDYWRSEDDKVSLAVVDGFLRSQFICSANGALVAFSTTDMPAKLVVHQSVLNVKSAGDAWTTVQRELQARGLRFWDEDDQKNGLHVIPLHRLVQEDFFVPRAYAESATRPFNPPKIESIELVGGNWSITLSGANKMKATILLDSKYQVISTRVEVGH